MESLERLGLTGSYQVHTYPTLLTIDHRAHQVFRGFAKDFERLQGTLLKHYPGDHPVWIGETLETTQLNAIRPDDVVVLERISDENPGGFYGLVWIVDRLLGPGGCPWDQEQTHASLKTHLIEEAYELCDAIDRNSSNEMMEELGDVLLQPLMHTQKKKLAGEFDIDDSVRVISEKLIRRHPHVFGDLAVADAAEVLRNWDSIKRTEKGESQQSILDGVPSAMPALMLAMEVSKRAARAGFEWPNEAAVWEKFEEELLELKESLAKANRSATADELGDLLFTIVNLARWMKIDPETALREMVTRFNRRFAWMEKTCTKELRELTPEEWDQLWNQAKRETATT
ncbi:nucleoside triphosphate pyrophosphohydrolase [Kamptonema cortianum]|nr:nucleoside triphosphate pyrophosphohydrolase [Geitlerinema splendidum]MDK3158331.1 nucleoside triphosphate pyrophosphohydrolase [Kamptonema cortianum]